MSTMHISIPESLHASVLEGMKKGGYRDASEYVGELIRADTGRKGKKEDWAHLENLLMDGLNSGSPIVADETYWKKKEEELVKWYNENVSR